MVEFTIMVEVELKFEIKKINQVIKSLIKSGFRITKKRAYEKTVMFDNPYKLMEKTDGRIRLRQSGGKVEFSYKIPITRKGVKKELEYEVEVSDFSKMEKILRKMEFTPTTSYERYKTEFKKGEIKATLDEFPFTTFLELEGSEEKIKHVAKALGFKLKENLTDSCDTIFTKRCLAQGLEPLPHIRFDNYYQKN